MDLEKFQTIFWWEYIHRAWGRFIGIVFAVPFLFFLIKGWLTPRLTLRLGVLLVLGGLQGVIGWWMVKSGLSDRPEVSQYRLAVHLGMALLILAMLFHLALSLLIPPARRVKVRRSLAGHAWLAVAAIAITITSGAFVAGTDAGLIYNSFPLMGDLMIPAEYGYLTPFWLNWFENPAAIQFNHRVFASATFVLVAALWWRCRHASLSRAALVAVTALISMVCLQFALGILTLLTHVPISLAATHQAVAVLLFLSSLATAFTLRPRWRTQPFTAAAMPA